jgi:predicted oxidoreductase
MLRKSIFFQQNSERKNTAYIQMWDQMLAETEITKSNITTTPHIIWSVEQSLKNLQTDYLDVFFATDLVH